MRKEELKIIAREELKNAILAKFEEIEKHESITKNIEDEDIEIKNYMKKYAIAMFKRIGENINV